MAGSISKEDKSMKDEIQLIPNEKELFDNLVHYENLIKRFQWRYMLSRKEAKKMIDELRKGLV